MPSLTSTVCGVPRHGTIVVAGSEAFHGIRSAPAPRRTRRFRRTTARRDTRPARRCVIALPATSGEPVRVDTVPACFDRLIIYAYPLTGLPGVPVLTAGTTSPGLAAACRRRAGSATTRPSWRRSAPPWPGCPPSPLPITRRRGPAAAAVSAAQRRLRRPGQRAEAAHLRRRPGAGLPGGGYRTLLRRLTLVVSDGMIEKVFYPVFPPDRTPRRFWPGRRQPAMGFPNGGRACPGAAGRARQRWAWPRRQRRWRWPAALGSSRARSIRGRAGREPR